LDCALFRDVYDRVGRYLIRYSSAESAFHKALTFAPGDPRIMEHLQDYTRLKEQRSALHRNVLLELKSHIQEK